MPSRTTGSPRQPASASFDCRVATLAHGAFPAVHPAGSSAGARLIEAAMVRASTELAGPASDPGDPPDEALVAGPGEVCERGVAELPLPVTARPNSEPPIAAAATSSTPPETVARRDHPLRRRRLLRPPPVRTGVAAVPVAAVPLAAGPVTGPACAPDHGVGVEVEVGEPGGVSLTVSSTRSGRTSGPLSGSWTGDGGSLDHEPPGGGGGRSGGTRLESDAGCLVSIGRCSGTCTLRAAGTAKGNRSSLSITMDS